MEKMTIIGSTLKEIKEAILSLNIPAFTAKQITEWVYKKYVTSFDEMSNISVKNRVLLKANFEIGATPHIKMQKSQDGTKKYLFPSKAKYDIESVFIPEKERATLCISSQVGCKMNCHFCMTGKQGFSGQLSSNEIINQIISLPERDKLTNVVFMGMGEPLDNIPNLMAALEILTADYGFGWSPKRITVSTIGVLPGLKHFLEHSKCHLAISLHSPFPHERQQLMPIEKAYPMQEVLSLIKKYDFTHQRRVSFEYILFADYNDSIVHQKALVKLLTGIQCRVNLIRFHAIPNVELKTTKDNKITKFCEYLNKQNINSTIRKSRGEDIFAACGMLSTMEKE